MLVITKRKSGTRVWLSDFPTAEELSELRKHGDFKISKHGGYKRLLLTTGDKLWNRVTMECPIKQGFII